MLCPYCLRNIANVPKCPQNDCNQDIPPMYREAYSRWRQPAILSTVGFSGHGKTVYLAAMLHQLGKRLPRIWPGFFRQGLDMNAINNVKENLALLEEGKLPESTRKNFPKPSLHKLANMPHFKERQLAIYDASGEAFEADLDTEAHAHFVKNARAVLFLVSLVDLEKPEDENLYRLLQTYILSMKRMKGELHKQHLVVVFSKADLLQPRLGDYPEVLSYLEKDDDAEIRDVRRYMQRMEGISQQLAQFLRTDLQADQFLNMATDKKQKHFQGISFCAVSALGSAPIGMTLSEAMRPKRVIDPLLWVLEKS